jgi:ABC-type branched-subunit amino acid transport system permease subunit
MLAADKTSVIFAVVLVALLLMGPWLPAWLSFLIMLSLAKALVVVGLVLLMRAGLVSFGQGLYYCLGGYAVGAAGQFWGLTDALLLLAIGLVLSGAVAAILGLLLCRYREIFFAMFTLAFSMILYGVLAKTPALGSTDGFSVSLPTLLGFEIAPEHLQEWVYALTAVLAFAAAVLMHRYFHSGMGMAGEAIRENEIRVEYLGQSARRIVYFKYIVAAELAALGGGLTAFATGHVDPHMAYWTTSGEFVFIALMGGTGHIAAPFIGALLFETVRTYAFELSPYTWQLALGIVLLAIILFLPKGLWSLFVARSRKEPA